MPILICSITNIISIINNTIVIYARYLATSRDNMKGFAQITKRGNSLGINITSICQDMGLKECDMVTVDVERVDADRNIVKRSQTGQLYRIYAENGFVEAEYDNLEDALHLARQHCEDDPSLVESVVLADPEYDYPDYNPQTGEKYGVINENQSFIGEVYFDGVDKYIFNPNGVDIGFQILPDGRIGLPMYLY